MSTQQHSWTVYILKKCRW